MNVRSGAEIEGAGGLAGTANLFRIGHMHSAAASRIELPFKSYSMHAYAPVTTAVLVPDNAALAASRTPALETGSVPGTTAPMPAELETCLYDT